MNQHAPEFEEAILIGEQAEESLHRTVEWLQKAHGMGRGDLWLGLPGMNFVKFYYLFRARRVGKEAQILIRDFHDALGEATLREEQNSLNRAGETEFTFEAGVVLADLFEDFLGDIWMQGKIETRRRKANIALVRVRGVLRALRAGDLGVAG